LKFGKYFQHGESKINFASTDDFKFVRAENYTTKDNQFSKTSYNYNDSSSDLRPKYMNYSNTGYKF